ncbi:MAG: sigma-70 family RNA polymerase sigma factor [Candidatus Marinimicrobia bacterium]|nr:sigma-70 family RNA polymerase sigma factor [Candidatus Neomarinimicrobiota bacterium]
MKKTVNNLMNQEAELIKLARAGDRSAQTELVKTHSARIYNLGLRIMRNEEDAEDVLQETFIIMLGKLDQFSGKSSLYTWLYRIATNIALQKLREKKKLDAEISVHEPNFEALRGSQLKEWPDHLEDKVNDEQFRHCLAVAMEDLPENYRAVFVLRDLENLSTKEAASVLSISEANVKVRLMRARLFLRDKLANHLKCVGDMR